MVIKLSSKGQLVIPKLLRDNLQLEPGSEFEVQANDQGQILLTPVNSEEKMLATLDQLRKLLAGTDLIADLEAEHRWEIDRDEARINSLGT